MEAVHPSIYHERQVRELCAVHALNNLFQGEWSVALQEWIE